MKLGRRLLSFMKAKWRDERGNASVSMAIVLPTVLFTLSAGAEAGVLAMRSVSLEHGIDVTVRKVRLGILAEPTFEDIKASVCENVVLIANCSEVVKIQFFEIDTEKWNFPTHRIRCVDRAKPVSAQLERPITNVPNQLMLVRACATVPALFPSTGIALNLWNDGKGNYFLTTLSGFLTETS